MQKAKTGALLSARNLSFVVLAAAIGISGYLSYLKVSAAQAACVQGSLFDCGTVLNSAYSELMGIPIAWLGLGTNLLVLALLLLETRSEFFRSYTPILVFAPVLFATVFSVYLIYIQVFRLQALCPWCLTHEALIFVLFGLTTWRLVRHMNANEAEEMPLAVEQVGD